MDGRPWDVISLIVGKKSHNIESNVPKAKVMSGKCSIYSKAMPGYDCNIVYQGNKAQLNNSIQSNFSGSNTFGTMKISMKQR